MLKIHFLTAFRTLLKNRSISIINICGLTLGLTAFLIIITYLFYEITFDSFFPHSSLIYRVNSDIKTGQDIFYHGAKTPRGLYFFIKKDVPGVEANGDAYFESCLMRYEDKKIGQQQVLWVDDGFERVFGLEFIKGSADFTRPLTGIIAQSKVHPLFGDADPIGKILKVNEGMPVEITGIFKDIPSNTHLTADYFISVKTWEQYGWISRNPDWNSQSYWNYVRLKEGTNIKALEKTLTDIVNSNTPRRVSERTATISLQPLKDLHYFRGLEGEMGAQTNYKSLVFLFLIALITIIIAWVNYVNLSSAVAAKRSTEIGMRKLIGASRFNIWLQSLIETMLLTILVIVLSLILYSILLIPFEKYFGIPLSESEIPGKYIVLSLLAVTLSGILFSSLYNTISTADLNPFSGKKEINKGRRFQTVLVIGQIAVSVIFISITLVVYRQINFMKKPDKGINLNRVITLNAPASLNSDTSRRTKYFSFKKELLQEPIFKNVTVNAFTPGQPPRYGYVEYLRPDAGIRPNSQFFENNGDDGLIETFGLNLLAGRNFSQRISENTRKVILNESSIKQLGFTGPADAIGKNIYRGGRDTVPREIIGVIADFHNEGMQKPIYPMLYNNGYPFEFGYYSVRLNTDNFTKAIETLKGIWDAHYPSDPIDYFFADEFFLLQYKSEIRIGIFYVMLTVLSIAISCLGLYGLIVFYLDQKRKEIGLRKINGAMVSEVLFMLNRTILFWVAIAFVIAVPVSYLVAEKWLQNFAYKIDLSFWIFVLAGLLVLFIAILTISWQSWKAATRNPVEVLRYE
jgi:putative ABC transport system permease protein